MSYLKDGRTKRQILLDIERKLDTLLEEEEQVIMADLYDRIIAGVAAIQSGDTAALQAHVAAIDAHLSAVDASELKLQGDDTAVTTRVDAIEAGLGKIANAVNPAPAAGGTSTPPASGDGTTSTPPSDGSQSADVGPGGPAAGVGSETTGQVDTPVTTG